MGAIKRIRELYYLRAFHSRALNPAPGASLAWKTCVIGGVARSGLLAPAGTPLRFRVKPAGREFFRALLAAPPRAAASGTATFRVEAKNLKGETLLSRKAALKLDDSPQPPWRPLCLPLSAAVGQDLELELSVSCPGPAPAGLLWGDPALLAPKPFWGMGRRLLSLLCAGGLKGALARLTLGMAWEGRDGSYAQWARRGAASEAELRRMSRACLSWPSRPKFSLLLTISCCDPARLRACVGALSAQAYPDWELCLYAGGDAPAETLRLLDELAGSDRRILPCRGEPRAASAAAANAALSSADGEFIARLDGEDELAPEALFEAAQALHEEPSLDILYSDEDRKDRRGQRRDPRFKPDWSLDYLLSRPYLGHLALYRRDLVAQAGGFRENDSDGEDYDLALRLVERSRRIRHIPKVLCHRGLQTRNGEAQSRRRALEDYLRRNAIEAELAGPPDEQPRLRYRLKGRPLVSILLPTDGRTPAGGEGGLSWVARCARSVAEKTEYDRYELLIFDNANLGEEARRALQGIEHRLISYRYEPPFNFAAKMNFALRCARGEHVVMLNDDVEPLNGEWLGAMLEHSQRPEVGGVGARLYFPNGTLQHAGVALAPMPFHPLSGFPKDYRGYYLESALARNCAAVTGACFMSRKAVLEEAGGMDERLALSFNDVDLCLRIRQKGYRIVYTPYAELVHHESATLGRRDDAADGAYFAKKWPRVKDPYCSPNLAPGDPACGLNWNF